MRFAGAVEYNGTAFHGWQFQKGISSIQATIEQALSRVANHPVSVVAAGRTDRGVHATNQIFHFDSTANRTPDNWRTGANRYLPPSIRLRWVMPVVDRFHARYSALARGYRYLIWNQRQCPGITSGLVGHYSYPLERERMDAASRCLVGKHDFSSFRAAGCQAATPVRKIESLSIDKKGSCFSLDVTADGFLQNMVRIITGCLLLVGSGQRPVEWMRLLLQARDRTLGAATMPASGLYLTDVRYDLRFNLPSAGAILPHIWFESIPKISQDISQGVHA